MPIQTNWVDPNTNENIPNAYWFLTYSQFDNVKNQVIVNLYGYVNLAAFTARFAPFNTKFNYTIPYASLPGIGTETLPQLATQIYNYIIANDPYFAQNGSIV